MFLQHHEAKGARGEGRIGEGLAKAATFVRTVLWTRWASVVGDSMHYNREFALWRLDRGHSYACSFVDQRGGGAIVYCDSDEAFSIVLFSCFNK